jgi:hypothetical protein
MMNVPPSEARSLSLWEYEALLHGWNEAHSSGDDSDQPDIDHAMAILDAANRNPALVH